MEIERIFPNLILPTRYFFNKQYCFAACKYNIYISYSNFVYIVRRNYISFLNFTTRTKCVIITLTSIILIINNYYY